ncbi:MAG: DUF2442 domain-containing protein [Candidatus Riflebacteria bacterium]|nr:DUF2442 domain-containing protein [Candidatus Riflebacteria bacterium]
MNPRVKGVRCGNDFSLVLDFDNGERRRFDCRPFLDRGVFRELRNLAYFRQVRVEGGTVAWPHEQDFCPDTLYQDSIPIAHPEDAEEGKP